MIYISDILNKLIKKENKDKINYHIKTINIDIINKALMNKLIELSHESKLYIPSDKINNKNCIAFNNDQYVQCKRCRIPGGEYCKVHIKQVNKNQISLSDWGRVDCRRIKYNFKTNKKVEPIDWCDNCDVGFDKQKQVDDLKNKINKTTDEIKANENKGNENKANEKKANENKANEKKANENKANEKKDNEKKSDEKKTEWTEEIYDLQNLTYNNSDSDSDDYNNDNYDLLNLDHNIQYKSLYLKKYHIKVLCIIYIIMKMYIIVLMKK